MTICILLEGGGYLKGRTLTTVVDYLFHNGNKYDIILEYPPTWQEMDKLLSCNEVLIFNCNLYSRLVELHHEGMGIKGLTDQLKLWLSWLQKGKCSSFLFYHPEDENMDIHDFFHDLTCKLSSIPSYKLHEENLADELVLEALGGNNR